MRLMTMLLAPGISAAVLFVSAAAGAEAPSANPPAAETSGEAAEAAPVVLEPHEEAFVELLTDAVLAGSFTIDAGGPNGRERHDERYAIRSVAKVADDRWVVNARITYGQLDVTVPVPVEVHWADDTPVLSVTDLSIPLVGSEFTARVMFYDGRYAGTWRHGKVGGLMFGRIERESPAQGEPAAEDSPLTTSPSESSSAP